jgi:threonine aldolase
MAISFGSDNHSGIHPQILKKICELNVNHAPAYGTDEETEAAEKLIQGIFGANAQPLLVFNGTAANVIALQSLIESYEAIIASDISHLQMDECGAPEKIIGAKILTVPSRDGKIYPEDIERHLIRMGDQHYSQPKVVSVTQPTEVGTCYTLSELRALREYTRKKNLYLHIDGARLIYAAHFLNCSLYDLTGGLGADAVSFGGTKNGLLGGEIVLNYVHLPHKRLNFIRKQNLQLPSKMRFISGQFNEFLQGPNPLWKNIASHGHKMAKYLESKLAEVPEIQIVHPVEANSVFVNIPKDWLKPLREHSFFYVWDYEKFVMRWMMSFDVQEKDIDAFMQTIKILQKKARNQ